MEGSSYHMGLCLPCVESSEANATSRGGKAAQSLAKAPGTVLASDQQENDKSVRALLHNYRTRRPLVLIIDDKYALFPFDLASKGCTYAVLGWYQIAHVWGMWAFWKRVRVLSLLPQPSTNPTPRTRRVKLYVTSLRFNGVKHKATRGGVRPDNHQVS